jgi:NAD(P)-dependent dehydrogenase (short-subunit alcohol dehydrogenase family)
MWHPAEGDEGSAMDLSGKVAVVTGAGSGLGLAYARALAASGGRVVVNDIDPDAAASTVDAIVSAGGTALSAPGPVGSSEVAERLVAAAVEGFGRLDVMVTNAGVLRDRVMWKMSDDDFDTVVAVHLRGTFTCARAAATRFREQGEGGRLILVGSPAGQRGNFGQTNYAAAKAGIAAMARTWALELARAEVTVNAVVPTAATAMTRTIPALEAYAAMLDRGEALPASVRRAVPLGSPDDCAGLVVFLASDASAGVTGQCIGIGGDRLSLWSHPTEVSTAFRDGGWDADAIGDAFGSTVGTTPQSYGITIPSLPEPPGA